LDTDIEMGTDFTLMLLDRRIITIKKDSYIWGGGSDTGTQIHYFNFDLQTKSEFLLEDILLPDKLQTLRDYVAGKLFKNKKYRGSDEYKRLRKEFDESDYQTLKLDQFYFISDGLSFEWEPYIFESQGNNLTKQAVPFAVLEPMLNERGRRLTAALRNKVAQ
jgi:hypothetical protein